MRWFVGAGVKHPFEYRSTDDICAEVLRLKGAHKSTSIWPHDLNSDGGRYTANIHFPLNWNICFQQRGWPVCVVEVHDAQSLVASLSKSSTCVVEVVRACTNQYQNLPVSFYMCVQLSL